MKRMINFKSLFLSGTLILSTFAALTASFFTNRIWRIEQATGSHYVCDIEPEIDGVYAHKLVTPTDSYFNTQKNYSMNSVGDITSVWDNYTGKGMTIAIIDDGFAYAHPEYVRKDGSSALSNDSAYFYSNSSYSAALVDYYKDDPSCIDEDWDSEYSEWATHGSNTSTTAAAPMNNGGIVGIAPEATILALKIDMSFVAIKAAINYAIDKNVDVISMSLGAYGESFYDGFGEYQQGSSSIASYLNAVCNTAYNKGIIVVAAAGNEATAHHSYPACNSHVIGVGALYQNSITKLAPFTNFVYSTETGEMNVDILAPGFVYAAGAYNGSKSSGYEHGYDVTQGTSFSCPIVAGAAALWKEKNPTGTPDQFLNEMQESAANIGTFKNKNVPCSYYSGYSDVGPSNITCGTLDVGALLLSSEPTGIEISATSKALSIGGGKTSDTLSANVLPKGAENQDIVWSTSDASVVGISSTSSTSGEAITITANGSGSATITATVKNTSFSKTCTVTVTNYVAVTGVTLKDSNNQTSCTLSSINDTVQLTTTILPSNASNKTYILDSSNEKIASVSDDGLVTAKGNGTATITALTEDGYFEATYTVTVDAPIETGFLKITSDQDDWSGEYLLVYENSATEAYCWDGYDGQNSYEEATISNNKIAEAPDYAVTIIIDKYSTGYSIQIKGDQYIGGVSGSNKISFNDSAILNTISYSSNSIQIVSNTSVMRFNVSSSQFRYYKSSSYSSQAAVQLYKKNSVNPTAISLNKSSLSFDLNSTTISETLTATVTPAGSSKVSWTSSNPSYVSVSETGLVTALKATSSPVTITATCVDDTSLKATCSVTVADSSPILSSLTLSNTPTTVKYFDSLDTSGIIATAHYTNAADKIVIATYEMTGDTKSIGYKTVTASYTEKGITKTTQFSVFCTNVGAPRAERQGEAITYSTGDMTSTSKTYVSKFNEATNLNGAGKNWTFTKTGNGSIENTNASKGIQFGSKSNPCTSLTISSADFTSNVQSITVNASGASSIEATLTVTVGNTSFKCNNESSVSITDSSKSYTFTGNAKGTIEIKITQTSSKALYLKSISVSSPGGTYYDWYGKDQAASTIAYLKTFKNKTCASSWTDRSLIKQLVGEYNAMIEEAKLDSAWLESFVDNGYNTTAINKLVEMVNQYNDTLQEGESSLTLNIPSTIKAAASLTLIDNNNGLIYILILALSIGALFALGFVFYKKKKLK